MMVQQKNLDGIDYLIIITGITWVAMLFTLYMNDTIYFWLLVAINCLLVPITFVLMFNQYRK